MSSQTAPLLLLLLLLLHALLWCCQVNAANPSSTAAAAAASVSGYLVYCPCMGRFGNQAEQFLGALAFARGLRRTLVVPPWIGYRPPSTGRGIELVPFARHFNLTALAAWHPTVAMDQFVAKLAPAVWPAGSRRVFCHSPREDGTCQAKAGNPFGPFWDAFNVSFDAEEFYGRTVGSSLADTDAWLKRYPSNRYPVLAFMGAPGAFPARPEHLHLHRRLKFSDSFLISVEALMAKWNMQRPILGVHLRNNVDFTGACSQLVPKLPRGAGLFSSYQCFGPSGQLGQLSMATCAPDDATVAADVRRAAKAVGARTVFVATDHDPQLALVRAATPDASLVTSTGLIGTDVFEDVALLSLADAVLLNCASSLSAFVRRTRQATGRPSSYLGLSGGPGWDWTDRVGGRPGDEL